MAALAGADPYKYMALAARGAPAHAALLQCGWPAHLGAAVTSEAGQQFIDAGPLLPPACRGPRAALRAKNCQICNAAVAKHQHLACQRGGGGGGWRRVAAVVARQGAPQPPLPKVSDTLRAPAGGPGSKLWGSAERGGAIDMCDAAIGFSGRAPAGLLTACAPSEHPPRSIVYTPENKVARFDQRKHSHLAPDPCSAALDVATRICRRKAI